MFFYIHKGISPIVRGCFQKISKVLNNLTPIIQSSFILYGTSMLAITGGYRTLPLVNSIVSHKAPQSICSLSYWPHPFPLLPMAAPFLAPQRWNPGYTIALQRCMIHSKTGGRYILWHPCMQAWVTLQSAKGSFHNKCEKRGHALLMFPRFLRPSPPIENALSLYISLPSLCSGFAVPPWLQYNQGCGQGHKNGGHK